MTVRHVVMLRRLLMREIKKLEAQEPLSKSGLVSEGKIPTYCHDTVVEVPTKPGLVEVLSREVGLEETLHPVGRLTVLPAGRHHSSPTDLLQSPTMRTILQQARDSYDITILDTPPVLAVADVLGLASMVEGIVMVVAVAETSEAQVADAADQLRASGGNLLGVVLNRSGGTAPGYYDQYRRPTSSI